MRVYVAAASLEIDRAERAIDDVRKRGWTVTYDWTAELAASDKPANVGLSDKERRQIAHACLDGLRRADVVWVLAPDTWCTAGVWGELVAAIALGESDVVVSGPSSKRTIFASLASAEVDSDEAALAILEAMAGEE
jgi:hypothetical protein